MLNESFARKLLALILMFSIVYSPLALAAGSSSCIYTTKKGDTLSEIAQTHIGSPVYPRNSGSLSRLLAMNPKIKNPTLIEADIKIVLANQSCAQVSDGVSNRDVASEVSPPPSMPTPAPVFNFPTNLNSFKRFGIVEVNALAFYSLITGTETSNNSTAKLLSKLNKGIDVYWRQVWSESLRTFLNFKYTAMTMDEPLTRTLENKEFSANHFALGVQYFFTNSFKMGFSTQYGDEVFYHSPSLTTLKIDTIPIPQVEINATFKVIDLDPFKAGIGASYSQLFSGSNDQYSVKSGSSYRGNIYLEQVLSTHATIKGDCFYSNTKQNTSIVNQTRTDVGISLGLEWLFIP